MRKVMLQCLLLLAAAGYFLAGLHSAEHLHHARALAASPAAHQSTPHPSTLDGDDCLICTLHAHTLLALPQWPLQTDDTADFSSLVPETHPALPLPYIGTGNSARAPPLS